MLKEDQVAELLRRCEKAVRRRLAGLRGNLKNAQTRAPAVWELICIDAFSQIGDVEYEPKGASSPDIVLRGVGTSPIWVEFGFLYPRNLDVDRQSREILKWIYREADSRGIPPTRLSTHFFPNDNNYANPSYDLPREHEKRKWLKSDPIKTFFDSIQREPVLPREVTPSPYTLTIKYDPTAKGPNVTGSGIVEGSPAQVEKHPLFRALAEKARQHKPDCPYVICVGTDQSSAISYFGANYAVSQPDVVRELFAQKEKVSAVITVSIEASPNLEYSFKKSARAKIYGNRSAMRPLKPAQFDALEALDFNRWRYYFPLEKWELSDNQHFHRVGGDMGVARVGANVELTIPESVLVDCLAGRTSLLKEYPDGPGEALLAPIVNGWRVVGCTFQHQPIEAGKAGNVVLTLSPPLERVLFGEG